MSAKMLLTAVKTLEVRNLDDDTLVAMAKSLEMVMDMSAFDTETQREAFTKLTEIREAMGQRSACVAEKKNRAVRMQKMLKKSLKIKNIKDEEVPPGSTENDALERLKIRSEEDGTLSFEFRGVLWNWNHDTLTWDYSPKK